MKIKKYPVFLSEKRLTIPELNKDESRWEMFLSKLQNKSPFIFHDGSEVIINNFDEIVQSITTDGELDMDKVINYLKPHYRYVPVIKTNKGDIKLNDFHKTVEFGGGAGTSLGSVNARTYETIQALFFSLRQYLGRDIEPGDLYLLYTDTNDIEPGLDRNTADDKTAILRDVKSTKNITRDDLKFFENKGWIYTYIKTANEFFKSLNTHKHYTFYHAYYGKSIPDEIYKSFKRVFHSINEKNNIRISMSRWNPSDLWAVESEYENDLIDILRSTEDITVLNTIMDSAFEKNYLVGISLKKIPFDKEIDLIISKTLHTNFTYDYSSASQHPFDTLTVQIHSKSFSWLGHKREETLDVRIYSGKELGNIFLEIRGSESKYGKSSLNFVNSILGRINIPPIPTYQELDNLTNEQLQKRISRYYKIIPGLKKKTCNSSKWNIKSVRSKLISKYQALILVSILEKYKNKPYKKGVINWIRFLFNGKLSITNYIIKEIFYYAYSMGGELFDNTMFYRIKTHR